MSMTVGNLKQILNEINDDIEIKILVQGYSDNNEVGIKMAKKSSDHLLIEPDIELRIITEYINKQPDHIDKDKNTEFEYKTGDRINLAVTAVNHIGDHNKKIVYTFKAGKYLYKWSTTKLLEMSNGRQYNLQGTVESVEGNVIKLKRCVYTLIKCHE